MKYFIISDIHGFYNEMVQALRKSGFRKTDPDHILIVCGDIFDRGPDAVKVYKYLKSLPRNRRVLIRGNHEYLLRNAVFRGYFEAHDIQNGTQNTVEQFIRYYYPSLILSNNKVKCQAFLNLGIIRWIFSNDWVNYYELGNYIFVHSFIPVQLQDNDEAQLFRNYSYYRLPSRFLQCVPQWRECLDELDWEEASWVCPWKLFHDGLFTREAQDNKILVCGHWHTNDFYKNLDNITIEDCPIYYNSHLIALDGCTAITHHVNVLVINDNLEVEK